MIMKKNILFFVAFIMVTLSLAACAGSSENESSNASATANQASVRNLSDIDKQPKNADDIINQYEQNQSKDETNLEESKEATTEYIENETLFVPVNENTTVDVDLSELNQTMLLSSMYSILTNPADYLGKTISIAGQFNSYKDDDTGKTYYYVYVMDEGGCCPVSLEFISKSGDKYPIENDPIEVTGVMKTYNESYNGQEYPYYYLEVA